MSQPLKKNFKIANEKLHVGEAILRVGSSVLYLKDPTRAWKIQRIFYDEPPSIDIVQEESGDMRNTTLENIEVFGGMPKWSFSYSVTNKGFLRIGEIVLSPGSKVFYNKEPGRIWKIDKLNFGEDPPSVDILPADVGPNDNVVPRNTILDNIEPYDWHSAPSRPPLPPTNDEKESIPTWRTEGSSVFVGDSELRVGTPVIYEKSPHLKWFIQKVYAMDNPPTFDIHEFESNREVNTTLTRIKPLCIPMEATTKTSDFYEDAGLCVVCMDKESTHALIPCGHKSYCPECANKLEMCALCRQTVTGNLRVFE